jgi:hypothetical protein
VKRRKRLRYEQPETTAMVILSESASRALYREKGFRLCLFDGNLVVSVEDALGYGITCFDMGFRMAKYAMIEHDGKHRLRLSLDNISPCKWTYADGSHSYGVEPRRDRKEESCSTS